MKLIIDYAKTTTTTTTLILSFGKHLKLKLKKKENSIFSSFFSFFNDYFSIIITPVTIYITGIMMMMIIFFGRWIIEKQNKTKQENIEMDCFVLFFVCQYSIWKWKKRIIQIFVQNILIIKNMVYIFCSNRLICR